MRANGYGDIVERTSKPSLAEQYLTGTPLMRALGTDSIISYQKNHSNIRNSTNRTCFTEYGTIPKGTQYHVR